MGHLARKGFSFIRTLHHWLVDFLLSLFCKVLNILLYLHTAAALALEPPAYKKETSAKALKIAIKRYREQEKTDYTKLR